MQPGDWDFVRAIYLEGITTRKGVYLTVFCESCS